jgi:hypothetical protein
LKKLSIKKLKLAAHIKETTAMLKQGQYPGSIDFKCVPTSAGGDIDYMTEWACIVTSCKKDLTLLYLDHMKAGYRDVKNEMNLQLLQLEDILDEDQVLEVVTFIKTGYKEAGNKASSKARGNFRDRQSGKPHKPIHTNRKDKAGRRHFPKGKPAAAPSAPSAPERKDVSREDGVQQLAALLSKVLGKQ